MPMVLAFDRMDAGCSLKIYLLKVFEYPTIGNFILSVHYDFCEIISI